MISENQLIPYHSSDLTGNRVLVFAPHPDDETLACGGSLAIHAAAGDQIEVVLLTNGVAGDTKGTTDRNDYIAIRRDETIRACRVLGIEQVVFFNFEDRQLGGAHNAIYQIIETINKFKPDLIYAPSAYDFHPDHRAAHFLICNAVKSCAGDFDIAFYEVNQLVNPNCIVDISEVSEKKFAAIDQYQSQLKEIDYKDISKGLNRFRSLTLPKDSLYAEAFYLLPADVLRKSSFITVYQQGLQKLVPAITEIGPLVSVIIRTKDRPELLTNALMSVVHQTYRNFEIVLVNDGGIDVKGLAEAVVQEVPITYIAHSINKGCAEAANSGLHAAKGQYINFLDDDDILYPEHLETLVSCCYGSDKQVVYSSIKNVYFKGSPEFSDNRVYEEVVYNYDFNSVLLLFFKYIPIMSVLFEREVLSKVSGFCESLDFFEDWDFWIRLSQSYQFHHVSKITAEYRFYDSNAKEIYWRKDLNPQYKVAVFKRSLAYMPGRSWVEHFNLLFSERFQVLRDDIGTDSSGNASQSQNKRKHNNKLTSDVDETKLVIKKIENEISLLSKEIKGDWHSEHKRDGFTQWANMQLRKGMHKIKARIQR
ncbi:MAG: PIG-L family deacetylase [Desulfobacteraceae bacterium]|jgi:LmbE family N-acetylglucosaminyl deacetylase/glycosyltransferase involved in cell wall biosynthesis|nr:PIG-L family deacetylase [Desulfobacteraceae bacterium]